MGYDPGERPSRETKTWWSKSESEHWAAETSASEEGDLLKHELVRFTHWVDNLD